MLAESGAKSRNKQGESRETGRVESGIKEARVGKQEGRESGNTDQSRETWTKETCDFTSLYNPLSLFPFYFPVLHSQLTKGKLKVYHGFRAIHLNLPKTLIR